MIKIVFTVFIVAGAIAQAFDNRDLSQGPIGVAYMAQSFFVGTPGMSYTFCIPPVPRDPWDRPIWEHGECWSYRW